MKKIITTVGTSLLTNYAGGKGGYTEMLQDVSKAIKADEKGDLCDRGKDIIKEVLSYLHHESQTSICAEISSITQIIQEDANSEDTQYEIHLIATDTNLSPEIACFIKKWFENKKGKYKIKQISFDKEKDKIKGLTINDPQTFQQEGIQNLLTRLNEIVDNQAKKCIINITGGYKALTPILTIYAQLYGIELKYLYKEDKQESNDEGMRRIIDIPSLPINIDWNVIEAYKPFLSNSSKFWETKDRLEVGTLICEGKIVKKGESFSPIEEDLDEQKRIDSLITKDIKGVSKIYELIKINKLIELKDGKLFPSIFGNIVKNTPVSEDYRGHIMEYVFFYEFAKKNKCSLIATYDIAPPFQLTGYFEEKNGKIILGTSGNKVGDIDLALKRGDIDVLGEVKALSAFNGVKENYHSQLIARALKYFEINPSKNKVEILLIVFQFQFKEFKEPICIDDDKEEALLKEVINYDYDNKKVEFKILKAKCLLKTDKRGFVNHMNFYAKPTIIFER